MLISEREIRKKEKSIPKANAGMLLAAEALKPKQKSKEELAHELELAKMKEARKKERREGRKKFFGKVGKGIKKTGKWLMSDEPVFQTADDIIYAYADKDFEKPVGNFKNLISAKKFAKANKYKYKEINFEFNDGDSIIVTNEDTFKDIDWLFSQTYSDGGKIDGIKLSPDEKKMIRNAYFTNNDVSVAMRYVEPKLKPSKYDLARDYMNSLFKSGGEIEGVDLFEDYENIPSDVQEILDAYEHGFVDGDYETLTKAHEELEKIGYTFDFYLDGQAYDLRKIGQKGKTALAVEEQEKEGKDEYDFKFVGEKIVKEFEYLNLKIKIAEYRNKYYGISNYGEPLVDSPKLYSTSEQAEKKIKETVEDFLSDETEEVFGRGDVVEESAVINLEGEDKNEQEIYYGNIHVPMNWALKSDSDLLNYLVVRNKISKKDYFALMKSGNYEIERMEMGGEIKTGCAFSTLFHCPVK